MSAFDRLPAHEQRLAEKTCHHRYRFHHGPSRARNLLWLRWWKRRVRRQMNRLYRSAHKKGGGGWRKDGRGWRYQILGGAYSGKLCVSKLTIRGNRVTGGKPRERLKAAAERAAHLSSTGARHSFYSQSGAWDITHGITGEPWGHRSDCSSWVTAMYWSCGLGDPNGNSFRGGFTGTLVSHGKAIQRRQLRPGDLIIYGDGNGHHVEMYVGPGDKTIGHGSPPVDAGVVDLLSGPKHYRSYLP